MNIGIPQKSTLHCNHTKAL